MHRNKEIILHFSIQILFIKFKSPRFVRIRAFFFYPQVKPTSQQANRSTSQRVFGGLMRPKSLGPFGSVWVRRVRLRELKHRFNPLKTQLTPIFLTNIPPPPTLTDSSKKNHTDSTDSTNKTLNGMSLVAPR